jgi:magnesium transporter
MSFSTNEPSQLSLTQAHISELREQWSDISPIEQADRFGALSRAEAKDFFISLKTRDQANLVTVLGDKERVLWAKLLPPDDLADLIQELPEKIQHSLFSQLDGPSRKEIAALLAYGEDQAGGLMNPRFARVRPDMTVDEAIQYIRRQATRVETTRYIYVLDPAQKLLGVVSLSQLFSSGGDDDIKDLMRKNLTTISESLSAEEIAAVFSQSALMAIPVLDANGVMKGIVTVDDVVQIVEDEATEDIQRLGGTEVLDAPYLKIGLWQMIRKRAGWLVVLFIGEMLTASAMGYFERELEKAIVLALFIPLIISSGGNSGSQASTLVVRAIALREVRLRDWWRVFGRELIVGMSLGLILGSIGLLRILVWPTRHTLYGEHFAKIGVTVAISLVGIVLWGSLAGSMLPFLLKRLKLDPATASAPFVATLVDVSGLVIYFTVASIILKGTLL